MDTKVKDAFIDDPLRLEEFAGDADANYDLNVTDEKGGALDYGSSIIEWQMCLGGNKSDIARSIQQTSDGGYIVAGSTSSNNGDVSGNHGLTDAWVLKLDANKAIQWQKCLGTSTSNDYAYSIQQTADGGYVFSGDASYNGWVVKLSSSGDMEWQKYFDTVRTVKCIQQTSDGGYIVAGYKDYSYNYPDAWVAKLAPNGAAEWQKTLGWSNIDYAQSVQQTSDGGYILAGAADVGYGIYDFRVTKLGSNGTTEWQKCLGGSSSDQGFSVQQTTDGGYIVAGYTYSNNGNVSLNQGGMDYWVVKIDSMGAIQWQRCLGGSNNDNAYSVRQTSDGGYVVAGYAYSIDGEASHNHGSYDFLVVKLASNGATEWQKCLGGSSSDQGFSVQQTTDGGYIVAGSAESNDGDVSGNHGGSDFWVVKIAPTTPPIIPATPSQPQGPASGFPGVSYSYSTSATDPNGGQLKYTFDWGDGTAPSQTGYISSGTTASASHAWSTPGTYQIKAKATDSKGASSGWSESRAVTIRSSNAIAIDESASESWIDIYSNNANDKKAVIWYEIEQDGSSGKLVVEVKDSEGKIYKWDEGLAISGRHSLIWDGRVANEYVSQPKNPYYISLILQDNGKEVARSAKHKVWVGRPVILLHGIDSTKEKMKNTKLYEILNECFYILSVEYEGDAILGNWNSVIPQFAGKLNNEIQVIKKYTGAEKIDIVAHSMGGLVARWHIQKIGTGDVGKLIMIGTPNHGHNIPVCPPWYDLYETQAFFEMVAHSPFISKLNNNNDCAYSIEKGSVYDDEISSTCQYEVITSLSKLPTPNHIHIIGYVPSVTYYGDNVVPCYSSKISSKSSWPEGYYNHGIQYNSLAIIDRVKLLLTKTDELNKYSSSLHEDNELDTNGIPVYYTKPITDHLSPGDVESYNIAIDPSSTRSHFLASWDNGTLIVTLAAPNGTKMEMDLDGNNAYYSIQHPDIGNWTVGILPISIPAGGTNITVQAFIENPLFIGVQTDKNEYIPQEPIKIAAYIGDNRSGLADALVVANISRPNGTTEAITLYDDGVHNDNQTDDGIYSNEYKNTSLFGMYSILVSASGSLDGIEFERETSTTTWVELYPDLTLNSSDVYVSNDAPMAGENVTISARIFNIGDADAKNSSIMFYDNDPASGVLIGEDVINIGSNESALASISWTAMPGWHDIHVLISPFNEFMEDSYENNNGSRLLIIKPLPTLNYPDLTDTNDPNSWRSWLVLQNPTDETANIEIVLRSRTGSLLYSGIRSMPAHSASAIRPRTLAGSDCAGSAIIASSHPITGTCQITRNSNEMCMGYNAADYAATTLYYPDFTDTANPNSWRSWLVLQNSHSSEANTTLEIRSRAGDVLYTGSLTIPAHGASAIRPKNLAGADCSGSVVITSDRPIVGTCQITRNSNKMCMSYSASDQGSTTLYYPDFTDTTNPDSWRSWLVLQNPSASPANLTYEIRSRAGDILYTGSDTIPAHGVKAIRPRSLAGSDCAGSVVVKSDQPIIGTCQITRNNNEMCMSYNALDQGSTTLSYPDFTDTANPDSWRSWLVLQNPTATAANITLEIRSRAGDPLYTGLQSIPAHGVAAVRPRSLVGSDCTGSVFVTSDQPIVGTCQISRNNNLMCMSYTASGASGVDWLPPV